MSKYTFELRRAVDVFGREEVESWFTDYDLADYLSQDQLEVITSQTTWTKDKLASQIVDHYYMREVGFETPALFKHQAKVLMKEIMEEKLPLIYTKALDYDLLSNIEYEETMERSTEASSNSETSSTGTGLTINSDTPQGNINKSDILEGNYATTTRGTEAEQGGTDSSSATGTESYTRKIKGRNDKANGSVLISEYRKTIMAINRDIIKELDVLFMGIF